MPNIDNSAVDNKISNVALDNPDNLPQDNQTTQVEDPKEIRYKQQLEWSRNEALRLKEENEKKEQMFLEVAKDEVYNNWTFDVEKFKKFMNKDPEFANKLAKQFDINGKMVSNAEEILASLWELPTNVWTNSFDKEKMMEELAHKIKQDMVYDSTVNSIKWKFNVIQDPTKKQLAQQYFEKLVWGRKLPESELAEFADMATLYVMKDNIINNKDSKIQSMGNINLWGNIWAVNSNTNYNNPNSDLYSDDEIKDYIRTYSGSVWQRDRVIINSLFNNQ